MIHTTVYLRPDTPITASAVGIQIGADIKPNLDLIVMDTGALDRLIEAATEAKRRMLYRESRPAPAQEDAA